jgi:hypothetical protein
MNKKVLFTLSVGLCLGLLYFTAETASEKQLRAYTKLIKEHPYNKRMHLSKKERKTLGLPPNAYFDQEYLNEINPNTGRTHPENILEVQQQLNSENSQRRVPGDQANNPWLERGPNNVAGRTRAVLFDPNDTTHKRVFAGGVNGGLWVNNDITDEDSSWQQVGISENLAITDIAVDPNNSLIMYICTGESYTSNNGSGNGVWKSIDGGNSWVNVFNDSSSSIKESVFYINTILAWNNPLTNKTEVFIGVGGAFYSDSSQFAGEDKIGLYKSINDGADWSKLVLNTPDLSPYEPNDLEIDANNTIWLGTERNVFSHGGGTVLKSVDGTNFTVAHTVDNGGRTEIAVSKQNGNTVYVLAEVRTVSGGQLVDPFLEMIKTTDSFASTSALALPSDKDTGIPADDFTRGQAFFDLVIEADPTDDTKLYAGGIDLFRSTDSGASWKQISKWSNNNFLGITNIPLVHADQHAWAFHPTDSNKALIGNDGGVFYASSLSGAENGASAIAGRNKAYNVTQFYHGAIGQDISTDFLLAGAQDNGTQFIENAEDNSSNPSIDIYGGDGAYTFIDKDGEYMIASYVYNVKTLFNLPYNGSGVTIDNDQNTGRFINPQALDDNLDILYSNASGGSRDSIAQYKDIKTVPVRDNLYSSLLAGGATALKVSPYTLVSSMLFVGTRVGKVIKVENANSANPTWTNIKNNISVTGSISSIEFGNDEDEIFVTFHNYGVKSIWYTTNGGSSWQSKEGDLPDIPVKAIMMNPLNNDQVIIGTELGVWTTSNFKDASPTWVQANNGMSNVKVTSFSLRIADNTVLATTYGRGMFTGQFTAAVASVDAVLTDREPFTIYPTVSKGNFTLYAKNTLGLTNMSIFDITGKQVYTKEVNFRAQRKQEISVSLKAGIYIVHLVDENNKRVASKIVIE